MGWRDRGTCPGVWHLDMAENGCSIFTSHSRDQMAAGSRL